MAYRLQQNTDGSSTVSNPSNPQVTETALEVAPAVHRQGGARHRFDASTGQMEILSDGRDHRHEQPQHTAPLKNRSGVTVMSESGTQTTLAQATPDSVVDLPGLGTTSVKAAITCGYVEERPSGRGFQLTEAALAEFGALVPQQQQEQQADAPDVNDLRGVPATSARTDSLVDTLSTNVPAAFEGMLTSIAQGKVPTALIADAARQLGDEALPQKFAAMHKEFIASGRAALSNVGVVDHADFERWALENHPDEASTAVREMVVSRNVGSLTSLGRRYVTQANTRLARLIQSKGIDTKIENGHVHVSRRSLGLGRTPRHGDFGGSDWQLLKEAIRDGNLFIG